MQNSKVIRNNDYKKETDKLKNSMRNLKGEFNEKYIEY